MPSSRKIIRYLHDFLGEYRALLIVVFAIIFMDSYHLIPFLGRETLTFAPLFVSVTWAASLCSPRAGLLAGALASAYVLFEVGRAEIDSTRTLIVVVSTMANSAIVASLKARELRNEVQLRLLRHIGRIEMRLQYLDQYKDTIEPAERHEVVYEAYADLRNLKTILSGFSWLGQEIEELKKEYRDFLNAHGSNGGQEHT